MLYFKSILLISFLVILSSCHTRTELGSPKNPIVLSLVPGQDTKVLSQEGSNLEKWFLKDLDLTVDVKIPVSFIAVVESIGSKRTDVAMMNTFGYILAHEKYGAKARLIGLSNDLDHYWGQIIARKDRIKKLSDLNGKKFAFVDPASTSGFILAKKLFKDRNITLREFVFAGRHDSVVTMVYQKQVDAGATFYSPPNTEPQDARKLIKSQHPDVFDTIQILEKTGPIPNDPVVFRSDFPENLQEKLAASMKKFILTEQGKKTMNALYHISGLKDVDDSHYDPARDILKKLGQSAQDILNNK